MKNPSGPTNYLVFQLFCVFEPFPTMTLWFWDPFFHNKDNWGTHMQLLQKIQTLTDAPEGKTFVAWSEESWFLLRHSDGRVRIWHKDHESMDQSCLVSVQAAGGVMVWGIFSWHTLGPLVPIEHRLNATDYLSIVADDVHPFMTSVYPSSDSYFQQDNAPCHKAQIISDWFLKHEN